MGKHGGCSSLLSYGWLHCENRWEANREQKTGPGCKILHQLFYCWAAVLTARPHFLNILLSPQSAPTAGEWGASLQGTFYIQTVTNIQLLLIRRFIFQSLNGLRCFLCLEAKTGLDRICHYFWKRPDCLCPQRTSGIQWDWESGGNSHCLGPEVWAVDLWSKPQGHLHQHFSELRVLVVQNL